MFVLLNFFQLTLYKNVLGPQNTDFYSDDINNTSEKRTKNVVKEQAIENIAFDRSNRTLKTTPSGLLKTRQLRDSDLTYFGIDAVKNTPKYTQDTLQEEIFHSVKLVQKVSNSVCNSEAESDDNQDYQNISNSKYFNVPTPKPRTKLLGVTDNISTRILNPIIEGDDHSYRRSRIQKTKEALSSTSRSISEPPKKDQLLIKSDRKGNSSPKRYVLNFKKTKIPTN